MYGGVLGFWFVCVGLCVTLLLAVVAYVVCLGRFGFGCWLV